MANEVWIYYGNCSKQTIYCYHHPSAESVNALVQLVEGGHRPEGGGADPNEPPPPEPTENSNATAEGGWASTLATAVSQSATAIIQTSSNLR